MRKFTVLLFSVLIILAGISSAGCKTKYDITGTWNITYYIIGVPIEGVITLVGSISSGTVNSLLLGEVGTYQVDGSDITFSAEVKDDYGDVIAVNATGTITDNNNMKGSFSYYYTLFPNINLAGTWVATR